MYYNIINILILYSIYKLGQALIETQIILLLKHCSSVYTRSLKFKNNNSLLY